MSDIASGINRKTQDRTATSLRNVRAQWVRMTMSWSDSVEPSDGSYSSSTLSNLDRAVDLARGAGSKIILTVQESPSWARDGTYKNSPPRDNSELAEFMGFLAGRYVGKVQAYEVWNEPNLHWAWPTGPNPGAYAQMLRAVAPSIRAADPTAKVIFGGLSRNDYEYVAGAYAAMPDIGKYFDVMATHPYVYYGLPPEAVWRADTGRASKGAFSAYREVRATMAAHGDTKPIWFTEFGWSTSSQVAFQDGGVSMEAQADYLTRAYNCLAQDSYVEVAAWHNLRNTSWHNDADTWAAQLGLMTTDFTPKPAYNALKTYVPGGGGCAYTEVAAPVDPQPAPEPTPQLEPGPRPSDDVEPVDEMDPFDAGEDEETSEEAETSEEGDETVTSSAVRSSPELTVVRAQLRRGRLTISASVETGATGRIRGRAHFGRGVRRFTTPIDSSTGAIRIDKKLRGARHASAVRVKLIYRATRRFLGQRVTFRAARDSAQLRVLKVASDVSRSSQRAAADL